MNRAIRPVGYIAAGASRMEWTLRLVETGIDGQSRSFEVMALSRPDGLGDIANFTSISFSLVSRCSISRPSSTSMSLASGGMVVSASIASVKA